jgi:hypothetical protein
VASAGVALADLAAEAVSVAEEHQGASNGS